MDKVATKELDERKEKKRMINEPKEY